MEFPRAAPYTLGIDLIRKFLPHRAPFLMVDRVLEIDAKGKLGDLGGSDDKIGSKVVALKNVSYNEPQFMGHFPEFSIFPGVLMIEAMAQTSSFILYPHAVANGGNPDRAFEVVLLGVDGVRFRKPVVPGDQVRIESTLTKCRGVLWRFECVSFVDGKKVAEAEILANMMGGDVS